MKPLFTVILWSCAIILSAQDFSVFKKEIYKDKLGNELPYRILYPKKYETTKKYPLIIFLHGSGERGNNNEAQLIHSGQFFLKEYEKGKSEAIVVLPQCAEGASWVGDEIRQDLRTFQNLYSTNQYPITPPLQLVVELLQTALLTMPQINKECVSVIGMSMGGFGTFDLLARYPHLFSKAVPICGGGNLKQAELYAPYTSIKIFHGAEDKSVNPDLSRSMYDRLKSLNADVTYTEYAGIQHNSWVNTFAEPGLMRWLCSTKTNKEIRYISEQNISYIKETEKDQYKQERCKLDIYYPAGKKDFATLIWFHGGGLEGGEKEIPEELKNKGIAVIVPNYRLSPKAKYPSYIEDAAEAVAWAFNNIASYGGKTDYIYVSGHSAGGYLTLMVGLDKKYLEKYDIDADQIRGLIPVSGQTNTHYTIKKERGLSFDIPFIDEYAPNTHARKDAPPILLISGDRNMELPARYEENALLNSILKTVGHKNTKLYELEGFNHGTVYSPACYLITEWIKALD